MEPFYSAITRRCPQHNNLIDAKSSYNILLIIIGPNQCVIWCGMINVSVLVSMSSSPASQAIISRPQNRLSLLLIVPAFIAQFCSWFLLCDINCGMLEMYILSSSSIYVHGIEMEVQVWPLIECSERLGSALSCHLSRSSGEQHSNQHILLTVGIPHLWLCSSCWA